MLCTSGYMDDVVFAHNVPYRSILPQRVASLRRRVQANTPAASYWLRRVLATAGAETGQVHRARGVGGGVCNATSFCLRLAPLP